MYKIIGADGKEYGPITADQLKQWITEGRANAQTKVLAEGGTEWKTLAEIPEFAAAPPITATPTPVMAAGVVSAADQVSGPAVGLIVTAILGFLVQAAALIMNLLGASFGAMQRQGTPDAWINMFSGTLGVVGSVLGMVVSGLILFGALKMRKLENHGWAMTASILALAPCISPCCLIGLPIGIWAVVVLAKPEVKFAFR
ncbi:MAG: DUF4339 domain-containing protein [Verrucomicrobia bacterium]|jgi:hypothetical protein|nr:DUF4339 domain-containing protein [Verrucomicrobiota bacterium]